MPHLPRRATLLLAAPLSAVLLAACGGSTEATRGSVEDAVRGRLADREDPITGGRADDIASCISEAMFDPDRFTPDERNAATSAADGEEPDPELARKVEDLVADCLATAGDDSDE